MQDNSHSKQPLIILLSQENEGVLQKYFIEHFKKCKKLQRKNISIEQGKN